MSACNSCPSDDVLSKIFLTLDVPDLLSCTKVSMKWRCIIKSLVLGRRFFERLKKSSAAWRRACRKLALDETNLKPEDYKNICWSCLQYLEQVDRNWRAGKYELKTSRSASYSYWSEMGFAVGEDFITAVDPQINCEKVKIFDRESVELKREFRPDRSVYNYQTIDVDTVACLDSFGLTFNDTKTSRLIRRFKLNDKMTFFEAYCPRANLWTVTYFEHGRRLALWRVDNASNVAVIKTIEVANPDPGNVIDQFKVDEQFIVHHQTTCHPNRETCHFISTGIVHNTALERSLSVMIGMSFHYDRSLMFMIKGKLIRILDVVSGTYLHDIYMSQIGTIKAIKVNLNYVVIIDRSNLYVYSLQALRNPLPSDAFVFKIERQCEIIGVAVDDTQIVLINQQSDWQKIIAFDFGSFVLTPIAYRDHCYVVCPAEKRFLLLFSFLKSNRKKKIMIFFSSCVSVKFHHELLNYMDLPVMCIHVSISLLVTWHIFQFKTI